MDPQFYSIGRFAREAGVSIRTLRHYDQQGLLAPSRVSPAGYRLYAEADLPRLQQILALKYLGFSLAEIRGLVAAGPQRLPDVLAQQRAMLLGKRAQLDAVITALDAATARLAAGAGAGPALVDVIQVMSMDDNTDWVRKYLTPEQRAMMEQLSAQAYTPEMRARLQARRPWTEADQQQASAAWAALGAEITRLTAAGADPAGPEAQAAAAQYRGLIAAFTGGDEAIADGLRRWWAGHAALPAERRPVQAPFGPAAQAFLEQALAAAGAP